MVNLFQKHIVPARKLLVSLAVCECSFELVEDPLYSPELATYNYHLFANLKNHFAEMISSYMLLMTFLTHRMKPSSPM